MNHSPLSPDWEAIERAVLARLKPFQLRTVNWAFDRLFADDNTASGRFLVADEVGLGKTMVARGVLARTLRRLAGKVERIDVVYICSNADIARQNLARLRIPGIGDEGFQSQGRLTLMPLIPRGKDGNPVRATALPTHGLNFQALTPGTSLDFRNEPGQALERALLAVMVESGAVANVTPTQLSNLFTQQVGPKRFRELIAKVKTDYVIDETLRSGFIGELDVRDADGSTLRARLEELAQDFPKLSKYRGSDRKQQLAARLIADLRRALASVCIRALEPDLLIVDEFQRFQHLLDGQDSNAQLARQLFDYQHDGHRARVLLLSATPYRVCSVGEEATAGSPYDEFLSVVSFLMRDDKARLAALQDDLSEFNEALRTTGPNELERLRILRTNIRQRLSGVMSRTDRTPTSERRDAMVLAPDRPAYPDAKQLLGYVRLHTAARMLKQPNLLEFWRSAPAPLSFLSEYVLRDHLLSALEAQTPELIAALREPGLFLGSETVPSAAESGHARTAALGRELIGAGMHRLLWLPPACPTYALGGAFGQIGDAARTKRLVFSSWRMVPRAVSTVLDGLFASAIDQEYDSRVAAHDEAERDYILGYPSTTLAGLGHVDSFAHAYHVDGIEPTLDHLVDRIAPSVQTRMLEVAQCYGGDSSGNEDFDWYWLGPLLADHLSVLRETRTVQNAPDDALQLLKMEEFDAWREGRDTWRRTHHEARVKRLREVMAHSDRLGRMPADLAQTLARLAISGPAICAMRALAPTAADVHRVEVRQAASAVASAVLHYLGNERAVGLLNGLYPELPSFWTRALRYCGDGCLQAVLDEYLAVLGDDQPLEATVDPLSMEGLRERVDHVEVALRLKPSVLRPEVLTRDDDGNYQLTSVTRSLRHARPLLEDKKHSGDDDPTPMSHLRSAFNSPFLPFVLSSTSIGQEGLDFHWYCHAIVHWNLPGSPVDFEQRDGRIHRYRNHAVRRNLARDWGGVVLREATGPRAWDWMFDQASRAVVAKGNAADGMRPAWIYQQGDTEASQASPPWMTRHQGSAANIERHVPVIPFSRDAERQLRMTQAVGCYRMVFAQPRQDDLLAHLQRSHPPEVLARLAEETVIDLRPPEV